MRRDAATLWINDTLSLTTLLLLLSLLIIRRSVNILINISELDNVPRSNVPSAFSPLV